MAYNNGLEHLEIPLDAELEARSLLEQYPNAPVHLFIVLLYAVVFGYFLFVVTALFG